MYLSIMGGVCQLSDDVSAEVLEKKWRVSKNGYAMRTWTQGGKSHTEYMHRLLTSAPKGMYVDHINGDTLDNRLPNLRVCTPKENAHNRRLAANNTSGVKGVSWHAQSKRWRANIMTAGAWQCLGTFATVEEAERTVRAARETQHATFQNHG